MIIDAKGSYIMLKFIWGHLTVVFAMLYAFQEIGMLAFGGHFLFVSMLFLSFVLIKKKNINKMVAANLSVIIVILTLWFSQHTFLYIQNEATLYIFLGATLMAELSGGFWGHQFSKDTLEMTCERCQ